MAGPARADQVSGEGGLPWLGSSPPASRGSCCFRACARSRRSWGICRGARCNRGRRRARAGGSSPCRGSTWRVWHPGMSAAAPLSPASSSRRNIGRKCCLLNDRPRLPHRQHRCGPEGGDKGQDTPFATPNWLSRFRGHPATIAPRRYHGLPSHKSARGWCRRIRFPRDRSSISRARHCRFQKYGL